MHRCVVLISILIPSLLTGCGKESYLIDIQTKELSAIAHASGRCSAARTIQIDDVSMDGSVVVGRCANTRNTEEWIGFRYSEATGIEILDGLSGKAINELRISGDGRVIWGSHYVKGEGSRVFRHTKTMGVEDLGTFGKQSLAIGGASADGAVIVGSFLNSTTAYPLLYRSFRYSQSGGFENIGLLEGDSTLPLGVSPDGSQVVGHVDVGTNSDKAMRFISAHAYSYSKANGMKDLGSLRSGHDAFATGTSNDGAVVVGIGRFMIGFVVSFYEDSYGFVRKHGQMQRLSGIDGVPTVIRISSDGTRISGSYVDSGRKRHLFTAKLAQH